LDPAHPLFLSLPTFRMVILADEILECFFDTGFANTFHLADQPIPSSASSLTSFTTFTNIVPSSPIVGSQSSTILPPGKGLRGMLDNIVSDGLRVAGEVRKRMEDAQRELDRASASTTREDEDDDDDDNGDDINAAESRSIRSTDHDLLDTAEAEALDGVEQATTKSNPGFLDHSILDDVKPEGSVPESSHTKSSNLVEFER